MKLTEKQKQIINSQARFIVCVSGRRGGKTYSAIASLAKYARQPNKTCLYVAPTHGMCRQVMWKPLKEMMIDRRWAKKINESNLEITLVNGSTIMLRSADTPDRLRGLSLSHCVIDEASDVSEGLFNTIIRPALADQQGSCLIITTPKARGWVYDVYHNASTLDDWMTMTYTTLEGGLVPEEEIQAARREMGEREFRQEFLAEWVDMAGAIYYAFGDHNITDDVPFSTDQRMPVMVGMDFNVQPMCAVIGQVLNDHVHIHDEIEIYGSNTYEMTEEIQQRYPGRRIVVFPDSSGKAHKTSAGGITDHIILSNAGFELKVGSVNPAVKDRIAAVNALLQSADGTVRLTVSPKCRKIINGLRKHVYKPNTRQPEKDGAEDFSHFNDALGYMVSYLYPVTQNINKRNSMPRRSTGIMMQR